MSFGCGSGQLTGRTALLRWVSVVGAVIGYGCLAAFLYLVGWQTYRWFAKASGHMSGWATVCASHSPIAASKDADTGGVAVFLQWLDAPAAWLGLHKVFEFIPASLALFAVSIAGNCIFIYCKDRLDRRQDRP